MKTELSQKHGSSIGLFIDFQCQSLSNNIDCYQLSSIIDFIDLTGWKGMTSRLVRFI